MKRLLLPTIGPLDWKRLLAKPDLHWKPGHSAMALAQSWEAAAPGFPPEVEATLSAGAPELEALELLAAVPEYEVALPGGDRPSQTNLLVLASGSRGLVCVAVEGKVNEEFGPTVGAKRLDQSDGVATRLAALHRILGLAHEVPDTTRYQLLHRTGSALLAAQAFSASAAVMLVHSFSPEHRWFDDFVAFAALFEATPRVGSVQRASGNLPLPLFLGWCQGDPRFLRDLSAGAV